MTAEFTVTPTIKEADMTEEMQKDVVKLAGDALKKYPLDSQIALYLKARLDKLHGKDGPWQVVVGQQFTAIVAHLAAYFVHFELGKFAFVVYKSPV